MRLKLYRARGMAEAMAKVRAELGDDALILATRRVGDGVEITAALEPDDAPPPPLAPHAAPPSLAPPNPAILAALEFHAVPALLRKALQHGELEAGLAGALPFAALPLGANERPLLLVGPPGAGKTMTVTRLATRLVMAGVAPMVITADGKRAGATEQLAAFTRLLGINLIVACHPVTLGRALTHRQNAAPVLIDTSGCDPFDPAQLEELTALATTIDAAVALVLPGGLDPAEAADLAVAYQAAGASLLVATRLDLTRRLGGILAASFSARLPLTEAGIASDAADGLVPITPDWLAKRLLAPSRMEPHQ